MDQHGIQNIAQLEALQDFQAGLAMPNQGRGFPNAHQNMMAGAQGIPNLAGSSHQENGVPAAQRNMFAGNFAGPAGIPVPPVLRNQGHGPAHQPKLPRHHQAPAHRQHAPVPRLHDPAHCHHHKIPHVAPAPAHMPFPQQPSQNLPHHPHFPAGPPFGSHHGQYGVPQELQPHGVYFNTPDGPRLFPNPTNHPIPLPNPREVQLLQMKKRELKDQLKKEKDGITELEKKIKDQAKQRKDEEKIFNQRLEKLQEEKNEFYQEAMLAQAAKPIQSDKTTDCQDLPMPAAMEPVPENGEAVGQFSIARLLRELKELEQRNEDQQGISDDSSSLTVPTSSDAQLAPGSAPATPQMADHLIPPIAVSSVTPAVQPNTPAVTRNARFDGSPPEAHSTSGPAFSTPSMLSSSCPPVTANSSSAAPTVQSVSPEVTRRATINSSPSEGPLVTGPALATSPTAASISGALLVSPVHVSSSSAAPAVQPSASVTPVAKKSTIWTPHAETLPHNHRAFTHYFTARRKFKKEAGIPALLDPVSLEYAQLRREADENFARPIRFITKRF
ncbi:hypothetical protein L3Y34_019373 [Caenorhabditis briggsae]|uniref:Uncharacterized protein n=1 Tax=Caenorhabditis briggsae TaxID=6238 RepID=A0AAE9DN30_CAEBR|nr:hypothetical protein L3Y34_019373 [Caenorhabditis briggsae]